MYIHIPDNHPSQHTGSAAIRMAFCWWVGIVVRFTNCDMIHNALRSVSFILGPWTVLVPTNAAFAKIPAQDLSAVINNTAVATDVIKYHMLQGQYNSYSFMFIKHYRYNSTNGHVLRIHRSAVSGWCL